MNGVNGRKIQRRDADEVTKMGQTRLLQERLPEAETLVEMR